MRTTRNLLPFLVVLLPALPACEFADVGTVAVTWRFNGHAAEQGNSPCASIGADRIVVELDGPDQFAEVVACDNDDPSYPLLWLGFAADLPIDAFGRQMRDVPPGRYDVRVFFIDEAGAELAAPDPWTGAITVKRDEVSRLDLDFDVTTGSISARWRVGGRTPTVDACTGADASQIHLVVSEPGGAMVTEATVACARTSGFILPGLTPGSYDLSGQLLDAGGSPITDMVRNADHAVDVADTTGVVLDFPWSSFTSPPPGTCGSRSPTTMRPPCAPR